MYSEQSEYPYLTKAVLKELNNTYTTDDLRVATALYIYSYSEYKYVAFTKSLLNNIFNLSIN